MIRVLTTVLGRRVGGLPTLSGRVVNGRGAKRLGGVLND
jgi:hypothetical protein